MSDKDPFEKILNSPLHDESGHRVTLEEALGEPVLPQRHATDIEPLVAFLRKKFFEEKILKENALRLDDSMDRYFGLQGPIPAEQLETALGKNHSQQYGIRDWTAAVEELLHRKGCPKGRINFGLTYKVLFNWDGKGGICPIINESLLDRCQDSPYKSTGMGRHSL